MLLVSYGATAQQESPVHFRIRKRVAIFTAIAALCAGTALMVLLTSTLVRNDRVPSFNLLEDKPLDEMDTKFLLAESTGESGRKFLQRLQRLWFVSSNRNMSDLQQEATRLATKLQTANFPPQVQNAIASEVNPCDDFYEFAV